MSDKTDNILVFGGCCPSGCSLQIHNERGENEGKMADIDQRLIAHLGIERSDLDIGKIVDLVVEAFIFHEEMADMSMKSINDAFSTKRTEPSEEIWGSFETNNTIAYALRHILLKASEMEQ